MDARIKVLQMMKSRPRYVASAIEARPTRGPRAQRPGEMPPLTQQHHSRMERPASDGDTHVRYVGADAGNRKHVCDGGPSQDGG
jgi:hypothetical protein